MIAWRGPILDRALQQFLADVYWGDLDYLIVDLPPGTGDVALSLGQKLPNAEVIVVTTPQQASAEVAERAGTMASMLDQKVIGVIENMAYLEVTCPNCGERSDIFAHGGARQEAGKLGVPFLGEVPLHMDIRLKSDSGQPIVVSQPNSEHAKTYREIAAKAWEELESGQGTRRPAPRIVIE